MSDTEEFEIALRNVFLEEATQLLEEVEQCFLLLESSPNDRAIIEKIFRLAHNLKGSANAVGFQQLGEFTHELESFLLRFKNGEDKIHACSVNLLLRCNDYITHVVNELRVNQKAVFDHKDLVHDLKTHRTTEKSNEPLTGLQMFEEVAQGASVSDIVISDSSVGVRETVKQKTISCSNPDENIRVSLQRVEKLINFVGEMVILQAVLREQSYATDLSLLRKTVHQLGKVTKEVQDISMSLRMVPLKPTFQKMQRIVRDTSATLNKKIKLTLRGEESELDKTVLEKISDPLVHLIRNAVDHGIEPQEARMAMGKSEIAEIRLSAYQENGSLTIEIRDDGAGLDPTKLKAKAIEKGILKPDAVITDKESYQLIFHSGFSTKASVTDLSGRGVGMDVVKTNIEQLQGLINLETELGRGTCFKIQLPLTMAIIDGMTVLVDQQRFVIPLAHAYESLKPNMDDLHHVTGMGEVYTLRGENLPLYRLSHLLGNKVVSQKAVTDSIAIVVRASGHAFAVLVDDIIGQNQVVIKQLGDEYRDLRGFSGSAILGDGRAALILELPELVGRLKSHLSNMQNQRRIAA